MTIRSPLLASLLFVSISAAAAAQQPMERIDSAMNAKIRAEAMDHSKIMWPATAEIVTR
jgi:hypothetical protein